MRITMLRRTRAGFTLLEVLLATAVMAVGTTSVLVVIATAAGMASQRQVTLRREQVVEEARHDAQAIVNAFRPCTPGTATSTVGTKKGSSKTEPAVRIEPDKVENRKSTRFDGFTYDLLFTAKDRSVPEKGYDVAITVNYGGGELHYAASTSLISTTIADEEFTTSTTFAEEKSGLAGRDKPRETR